MAESAFRKGLTTPPRLEQRARSLQRAGRAGPGQVLDMLHLRPPGGGADSDGEVILLQVLRHGGAPTPRRQIRVAGGRFDLGWFDGLVLAELDGDKHRTVEQMRRDARKQNRAVLRGSDVLRFTWDRVENEPDEVVREVLTALAAARSRRSGPAGQALLERSALVRGPPPHRGRRARP
jgi:very-short-patch-repair endonuclease